MTTHCNAIAPGLSPAHFFPAGMDLAEAPNYDSVRILVVNDDMRSAGTIRHALAALGYSETLIAYSGKRALAAAAQYSPSIAIVDLEIEDMTGYRLARMLKSHARREVRELPLIAVAERQASATEELARAAGFVALLTKPIRHWELSGHLSRTLT